MIRISSAIRTADRNVNFHIRGANTFSAAGQRGIKMELRRAADQAFLGKIGNGLMRIRTELIAIIILMAAVWFLPVEAKQGLMALFITKAMFVTLGVLYAHASRKFLFPYLDMEGLIKEHHWGGVAFLTAYYGVVIWAFAVGG